MPYLEHYGTPRHSGRYPWGSGENPYQSEKSMMRYIEARRKEGATDKEIAAEFLKDSVGFTRYVQAMSSQGVKDTDIAALFDRNTTWLRQKKSIAKEQKIAEETAIAIRLREHGYSYQYIADKLNLPNESTVRSRLENMEKRKKLGVQNTADALKEVMKDRPYLDVGRGNEALIGVSATRLNTAVSLLKDEGYLVYNLKVNQVGTGYKTTVPVLCPPGTTIQQAYEQLKANNISLCTGFKAEDNGEKIKFMEDPISVNPKRVSIRYAEQGGTDMDGVIELRRGVEDLSMGAARYCQARILVGEDRYLKGMCVYADDLPDGVDIRFNTNKHEGTPMEKVLKEVKRNDDGTIREENMFGAAITDQIQDPVTKKVTSAVNIVNQEGDWADWKKTIASQMLSKQPVALAKEQLAKTYLSKEEEFETINSLTNPAVKRVLLEEFAKECDSATVHLKAQGFDRQAAHVILPVNSLKDNEIYAPRYQDGETVVLIRFPHAGQFEIPELKVNNKNKEAIGMMGKTAKDAVGINSNVAAVLSGADFDGDTVLVIPNNDHKIKRRGPLSQLENFDPKSSYPAYEGMVKVGPNRVPKKEGDEPQDGFRKGREMGDVSNLITDMTIKGADEAELARAVKYSMVVIDAEKHNLNWKLAYQDCNIAELKKKYQGGVRAGASTLISRAKSQEHIPQLSLRTDIDEDTGALIRKETGNMGWKTDKDGNWVQVPKTTKSNKMTEAFQRGGNAYDLISSENTAIERTYADYANKVHDLANRARKESKTQPSIKVSPSAKEAYAPEVTSLKTKVLEAKKNAAYEKQVNILVNSQFSMIKRDNPDMDYDEEKRIKSQLQQTARKKIKGEEKKSQIQITAREWEAIQAGAISNTTLQYILTKADMDQVKNYATPRKTDVKLSANQISAIKTKMNSDRYTAAEIAADYGISVGTVYDLIKS